MQMKISEFGGEAALIDLLRTRYASRDTGALIRGIGDDAALIKPERDKYLVATTDLLIEGTHFRRDIIDPYSLGWKATTVNISDIAAMAGLPTFALVSIALDDVPTKYFEEIYRGIVDACNRFSIKLAGGDTNSSISLIGISVALLGEVEKDRVILRSTAKPGDAILVTGSLGESRAGMEILMKHGLEKAKELAPMEVERHIRPLPRVAEARHATAAGGVTAGMDISDGLTSDLNKLCQASNVGAIIYSERLPISPMLKKAANILETFPALLAEAGGEDYELLLTVKPDAVESVTKAIELETATDVTVIGEITAERDIAVVLPDGSARPPTSSWEHF